MDWFFFGGERTLDDGKSADYISHSNKFPQQSALLGIILALYKHEWGNLFDDA